MDERFQLNFRSVVTCGINSQSVPGTGFNSRYDKAVNSFIFFHENPNESFDILNEKNYETNRSKIMLRNFNCRQRALSKLNLGEEEKAEFIKIFNAALLTNDFTLFKGHNQIITVPTIDTRDYLEEPKTLIGKPHDTFGGCFLVRNTESINPGFDKGLTFHEDVNLVVEDNIFHPTDCTVLSDWVDRFHMELDDVKILAQYIFLKNRFEDKQFVFFQNFGDSVILNLFIENLILYINKFSITESLSLSQYLVDIKIHQFDLEGMTILLFLIHKLSEKKNNIRDILFENILENISKMLNDVDLEGVDTSTEILSDDVLESESMKISHREDFLTDEKYNELRNQILNCIQSSNYVTSILSYACRPYKDTFEIRDEHIKTPYGDEVKIKSRRRIKAIKKNKQTKEIREKMEAENRDRQKKATEKNINKRRGFGGSKKRRRTKKNIKL
jgi:hypothetical protein